MEGVTLRPMFTFNNNLLTPPKLSICSKASIFPQLASPSANLFAVSPLLSASSLVSSSVTYAAPGSQLSAGVETETREWTIQDFYSLRRDVETASARVEDIRSSAGMQQLEKELADLESKAADSSFWDDRAEAHETLLATTDVKDKIKLLTDFQRKVEDAKTIVNLTEEMHAIDGGLLEEAIEISRVDLLDLTEMT